MSTRLMDSVNVWLMLGLRIFLVIFFQTFVAPLNRVKSKMLWIYKDILRAEGMSMGLSSKDSGASSSKLADRNQVNTSHLTLSYSGC